MAEMMKKATRQSYGEALVELAKTNPKVVVLDADLAHATQTIMFKEVCPERFFNAGIAENNMIGVAAGLSTCGYIPFASTFAMFAAGRSYDQVRNMLGYPHNNVKICATHAGISVGEDGATHQCNEDIALMRVIPGLVVMNPADDTEAKACIKAAVDYQGPVYIRLGRMACPIFNDPETYKFEMGKGVQLKEGTDVTIVATGLMVYEAIVAAEKLAEEGISAAVVNIHTIKPLDTEIIVKNAAATGAVVTAEEHSIIGGLGSAVAEALAEGCPVPMVRLGVNDEFGHSGPAGALLKEFGLTADNIVAKAKEAIAKKK
ncbi:MAG: transketolase family protein [Oscillospiraceae bacterium]|nr:transketolase family protein [Oscillospiraceae bacterium]